MDEVKVTAEIEASDQLGMLVRRVQVESPVRGDLQEQAAAIVERIDYLGGELKVIEVDGVSKAVQIRSKKAAPDGYIVASHRCCRSVRTDVRALIGISAVGGIRCHGAAMDV